MTISLGMIWDVRNGGDDDNGGGFRGGANVAAPSAPTVNGSGTGGTVAANTYYIVVTVQDRSGESEKSPQTSVTTTGATSSITVTDPTGGDPNKSFSVYVGTVSGGPYWSDTSLTAGGGNRVITTTPPTSGVQAPGVDRSQQTSPQVVIDNSTITATTPGANSNVLTFTGGYTPTSADVGNVVHITAGTNMNTGWYEIIAWSSTTWTVTGTTNLTGAGGAGAAIEGVMGGSLETIGMSGQRIQDDNGRAVFVKYHATPYDIGSASFNIAGGAWHCTHNGSSIVGWDTTRDIYNADANRPTIRPTVNSVTCLDFTTANGLCSQIIIDNNSKTGTVAFNYNLTSNNMVLRCKATGVAMGFIGGGYALLCQADATTTAGFSGFNFVHACACTAIAGGIGFKNTGMCMFCIGITETSGVTVYDMNGNNETVLNCVAYSSTRPASSIGYETNLIAVTMVNCISWNLNRNYHGLTLSLTGAKQNACTMNCASGNGALIDQAQQGFGPITITADPFTNAAGNDFSLNSTAGGGAACKQAGIPGSTTGFLIPGLSSSSYPDIGAIQTGFDSSGGGPVGLIFSNAQQLIDG